MHAAGLMLPEELGFDAKNPDKIPPKMKEYVGSLCAGMRRYKNFADQESVSVRFQ